MSSASYLLLGYQYRDADNFKAGERPFVLNDLTELGVARLEELLQHDFIPGLIGLRDLQNDFNAGLTYWDPERDHLWHEFVGLDVAEFPLRNDAIEYKASQVLAALEGQVACGWDETYRPPFFAKMTELKGVYDADPDAFMDDVAKQAKLPDFEP